jgi:hypothetical protein
MKILRIKYLSMIGLLAQLMLLAIVRNEALAAHRGKYHQNA